MIFIRKNRKVGNLIITKISSTVPDPLKRIFPKSLREKIIKILLFNFEMKAKDKEIMSSALPLLARWSLPHLNNQNFPSTWRPLIFSWLKRSETSSVCVIVHVYFLDLLPEILRELGKLPFSFDLILTNSSNFEISQEKIRADLSATKVNDLLILRTPNRGRDILPLIFCVNSGILDQYHYIFKFHTKKSTWASGRKDMQGGGEAWRQSFFRDLIGIDGSNAQKILDALKNNISLGIVTADGSLLKSEFWTSNFERSQELASRLEIQITPENLVFPAGSFYACKALVVQGLRALCLSEEEFEDESAQIDGTTAHAVERLIGVFAQEGGYELCTLSSLDNFHNVSQNLNDEIVKYIAYYLPQFHSDPINDLNWGLNFTEWNNVTSARPQFSGHMQPLLPTELGFYNLDNSKTVLQQCEMASLFGLSGFMYYHYDFCGKTALSNPLKLRLKLVTGQSFSLMWVNENWTRNWDGLFSEVIVEQRYESGWEIELLRGLKVYFDHPDYLRDKLGNPIISIYKPQDIPDLENSLIRIRENARLLGIGELHILFTRTQTSPDEIDFVNNYEFSQGFHEFPPHGIVYPLHRINSEVNRKDFKGNILSNLGTTSNTDTANTFSVTHPGVLTKFDNTARRGSSASIILGGNPYEFRKSLLNASLLARAGHDNERLVFINAWNEWAEGAVLEPSNRFGKTYLLAIREISLSQSRKVI